MKLRGLITITASILAMATATNITEGGKCNEFRHNCNDEAARMYEVTCSSTTEDKKCTCTDDAVGTETCATEADGLIIEDTYDSMTLDRCEALCKASNTGDAPCKYFRWELHRKDKTCSLMTEAQCTAESNEVCKDKDHCFSDGIDCGSGPIPPTPPDGPDCKMLLKEHSTDKLMWLCYNIKLPEFNVDVYATPGQEVLIPDETVCETVHPCDSYGEDNKLVYICGVQSDGNTGKDGEWAYALDSFDADTEILPNQDDRTTINVEASCPLDPLGGIKKTAMDLPGADLVCTGADLEDDENDAANSYQLPGPNTCILMCDLNHILTVYSDWTPSGKSWLLTFEEDKEGTEPAPITTGDEIYCWP